MTTCSELAVAILVLSAFCVTFVASPALLVCWWFAPDAFVYIFPACVAYIVCAITARALERADAAAPPVLPPLKGWHAHRADADAVHRQFLQFLRGRTDAEQHVSIRRGGGASNRTCAAEYKERCTTVDVSTLDTVIDLDACAHRIDVQPGVSMDELTRVALAHGVVPLVVLEFPGITVGGAVCGGGIESSSHKAGSFFDTVEEVDIITGDGEHRLGVSRTHLSDLFHAVSASFGSLGILTRVRVRVQAAHRLVRVRYAHFSSLPAAAAAMQALADAADAPDFMDAVAVSATSVVVVTGVAVSATDATAAAEATLPPRVSLRNARGDAWFIWHLVLIARRLAAERSAASSTESSSSAAAAVAAASCMHEETLSLSDYLFRFDRAAFWMADACVWFRFDLVVRQALCGVGNCGDQGDDDFDMGPPLWLRLKYAWLCSTRELYRMLHCVGDEVLARTYIVQDFIMPGALEACHLADYTAANGVCVWPLWVCPVRQREPRHAGDCGFGLPQARAGVGGLRFNVGVYGIVNGGFDATYSPYATNRALEIEATRLGGRKMLYAQTYASVDEFWRSFDRAAYDEVRTAFGAHGVFPNVADKVLLGDARLDRLRSVQYPAQTASVWLRSSAQLALCYARLWAELLLPRAFHTNLGISHAATSACSAPSIRAAATSKQD